MSFSMLYIIIRNEASSHLFQLLPAEAAEVHIQAGVDETVADAVEHDEQRAPGVELIEQLERCEQAFELERVEQHGGDDVEDIVRNRTDRVREKAHEEDSHVLPIALPTFRSVNVFS